MKALATWGLAFPLTALAQLAGPNGETLALVLACTAAAAGVVLGRYRYALATAAALILVALLGSLAFHFGADHFQYRYVWLYSAAELPVYLKLTSVWGGDEGTLLMMAAVLGVLATRLVRYPGWSAGAVLLYTAGFTLGTILWNPFAETAAGESTALGRGMNVHLMSVWMALHPPLVFLAYALVLVPAGAALESLFRGTGAWPALADRCLRLGWLLLTAGVAVGMWWAFEDFTFGQIWHWDPVQTSVFVIWALVTAQLHGLARFRTGGPFARSLPLLATLAAAAVFASMVITRNAALASSHRYVGDTSAPLLAALGVLTALGGAIAWLYSHGRRIVSPVAGESTWLLRGATVLFVLLAVIAGAGLIQAFAGAYLQWPRPEWAKPFFETLARWSGASEQDALRQAFDRWEVDNFGLNRWMAPLAVSIMLLAGHGFSWVRRPSLRWAVTGCVALAGFGIAAYVDPLQQWFDGTGVTSQQTVALFFWLDVMAVFALYLLVAVLLWIVRSSRRPAGGRLRRLGVALVHGGAAITLPAMAVSMVLDSYVQGVMSLPQGSRQVHSLADGYAVDVSFVSARPVMDGGRDADQAAFRAVARVDMTLTRRDGKTAAFAGETLYRNQGEASTNDPGPVRQLCQILDYRYARFVGGPRYILNPFIDRGWSDTRQVWVSPRFDGDPGDDYRAPSGATVVIRTYPWLTWVWVGLALIVLGAVFVTVRGRSTIQSPPLPPSPLPRGEGG